MQDAVPHFYHTRNFAFNMIKCIAYGYNKRKGGKAYGISTVLDYFYITIAD